ncbi:hypothetical protein BOX15_Mlig017804g1 [Macrostomum lignano]|uniref:Major facilitator superfamily (MFS) profile domain-containing protein n=1 Tax=Macrostomum lignano TaxID=282301 RepID=A0A267H8X5_9PLAT|nr:hypothetical protein BOX15_Mlig017804g1 [Macrostomum lignano]
MGFLLFCPLWGFLADQHGRRGVMILGMAFTGYYMLISALSPSFEWLVFLRTVAGAFMATTPQGLVYMVECCPGNRQGLSVEHRLCRLECRPRAGARRRSGTQRCRRRQRNLADPRHSVCPAHHRQLRGLLAGPGDASFYLVHGQMDKCKASLRHIARVNGRESDFDWDKLRISQEAKTAEAPRVKWLFSRRLRSLTLGLAAISFLTNFTYYGGVLFAQQLVQESGMSNSVAEVLQSSCGGADCRPLSQRDYVNLLVTALSEVPGTVIALSVSAYLERRRMLQVTAGLAGGFTLLLMLSSLAPRSAPLLVSLLFFARGSAVVTINISNIYAPEAFPTRVRALGVGLIQLTGKCGCILTPLIAQVVMPASRIAGLVVYAGAFVVVVLLAAFCLSRETKDADLEDH